MIWKLRITIETQRGRLPGEVGESRQGRLEALSFASAVRALRDASAGPTGGRRQHQPLTFSKRVGAATPLLAQAACAGEVLRSVVFEFVRFADGGVEEVEFVVRLHDATVSGHRLALADVGGERLLVEDVDLTYRRIEWEHAVARTVAGDAW